MNWYKTSQAFRGNRGSGQYFKSENNLYIHGNSEMTKIIDDIKSLKGNWGRPDLVPFGERILEWKTKYRNIGAMTDPVVKELLIFSLAKALYPNKNFDNKSINDTSEGSEAYHLWNADLYILGSGAKEFGYIEEPLERVTLDEFEREINK